MKSTAHIVLKEALMRIDTGTNPYPLLVIYEIEEELAGKPDFLVTEAIHVFDNCMRQYVMDRLDGVPTALENNHRRAILLLAIDDTERTASNQSESICGAPPSTQTHH